MSVNDITFEPVNNINIIKNYDGFIDQEGNFYKVSKKNKHNPTHIKWAEEFVMKKKDYIKQLCNPSGSFLFTISRLKNKQEILIHFYGFIYYGHDAYTRKPIIIFPDNTINDKYVSKEQIEVLFKILHENNELDDFYLNYEEQIQDNKHEKYVDSFITKTIERNIK